MLNRPNNCKKCNIKPSLVVDDNYILISCKRCNRKVKAKDWNKAIDKWNK